MASDERKKAGEQTQDSRQSGQQGREKSETGKPGRGGKTRTGIGSSQGQDRGSPAEPQRRPSAGTPDIERGGGGGDVERGASTRESLVQDPTGAFKERP